MRSQCGGARAGGVTPNGDMAYSVSIVAVGLIFRGEVWRLPDQRTQEAPPGPRCHRCAEGRTRELSRHDAAAHAPEARGQSTIRHWVRTQRRSHTPDHSPGWAPPVA